MLCLARGALLKEVGQVVSMYDKATEQNQSINVHTAFNFCILNCVCSIEFEPTLNDMNCLTDLTGL